MKQSSIEWLFEQYKLVGMLTTAQVQKAKAMHKEEIEHAHTHGRNVERGFNDDVYTSKDYYHKTFSTKEK